MRGRGERKTTLHKRLTSKCVLENYENNAVVYFGHTKCVGFFVWKINVVHTTYYLVRTT